MKITRTSINFVLDCFLLLNFTTLIFVSVVVRFVFPAPTQAADWSLWAWSLDQWMQFQFAVLAVLALAVLLHVTLHWPWVCGVVSSWRPKTRAGHKPAMDDGSRTIAGVGLLVVLLNLLGSLIAAAALMVNRPT